MLRSGQPLNTQWRTVNRQGARGGFHNGEIIASRDAIENRRSRMLLGGGGINYQSPIELDPTVGVGLHVIVYLSPNNDLVTTGLYDLVSETLTQAVAGTWISLQPVPAQVVNPDGYPAGTYYNVPQLPYPGASGSPTGSPLKGDLDGPNVFWHFISGPGQCY